MDRPWSGKSALIVDDDGPTTALLSQSLTETGVRVLGSASAAPEALRLVGELKPDVITMDIHLSSPGEGEGIAAVTLLRATDIETRVLFVVDRYDAEEADDMLSLGRAEVIDKPISLLELEEALERLFTEPSAVEIGDD